MAKVTEDKLLFALLPFENEKVPGLLVGIPRGAWDYMRDGNTHTLDLTRLGIPVRLMLFGAETHADALKTFEEAARANGVALLDQRHSEDFSWNPDKNG